MTKRLLKKRENKEKEKEDKARLLKELNERPPIYKKVIYKQQMRTDDGKFKSDKKEEVTQNVNENYIPT